MFTDYTSSFRMVHKWQNLDAVLATNLLNRFGGENQYPVLSNKSPTLVAGRKFHLRVTEQAGNTWSELGFTEVTVIEA